MLVFKLLTFVFLFLCKELTNGIELNALVDMDQTMVEVYHYMVNSFNEYAKDNDLDINLKLTVFTQTNSTTNTNDTIKGLLNNKSTKYDLYIYDNKNSANYVDYFINLYDYLTEGYISLFNDRVISDSCVYHNKLFGLPVVLFYDVLYANKMLLKKYNHRVPRTWDELIEISKFIIYNEKLMNNTNIIGYNGEFTDDENGSNSIYEFINTFRDSPYDFFPGFRSRNAYEALVNLKIIKQEISSDEIFRSNKIFTLEKLYTGRVLFAKFENVVEEIFDSVYYKAPLPGKLNGVSGSFVYGKYLGIPNNISEEKKKAAAIVLSYLTSYEMQKKMSITYKQNFYSPIKYLYDDEEVCTNVDCGLMKMIQPVFMPIREDYDSFAKNLRESIYDYLYNGATVEQALSNIEKYIELNDSDLYSSPLDDYNEFDPFGSKASQECQAEVAKSMACIEKIYSEGKAKSQFLEGLKFETVCMPSNEKTSPENCKTIVKQGLDAVCGVFEYNECKDFIAEDHVVNLINSRKCEKSEADILLLGEIAALKSVYLLGCKKSDSGDLCPLGQYATTKAIDFAFANFQTIKKLADQDYKYTNVNEFESALDFGNDILTLLPVLNDLRDILINNCSDASCNKNIIALDKMILASKEAYNKNQNVDLTKQYPELFEFYDSTLDIFRKNQCNMISKSDNSGATTLKKITYSLVSMIVATSVLLLL
ncbi:periplasmic binding protein-like II [Neocallimastix lanati (nom. inval.)]|jgi:ABC-type glycerol-3-phosphate transport system substrate-binding protein|uniref:Periplasmic binding protein-like II n=1 Tax=Neocallimastix californiae TaxID=1754190 RepID=A0A1Y2EGP1_9FUNG|nr:periplasmic binding protein-like II [Neocallimastix sp. JGI-2020a]ORY70748.1 periplasmic binding protein-like II [Neocallimastix californiae]|eukprot:ORY70748.1 periplasmic binding protein-like II [Neocallimastix californiae]